MEDCRTTPCVGLTWCDLTLGVCKPGCSQSSQCDASEVCDAGSRACVCPASSHRCNGVCVSDFSVSTCGGSCSPCPTDPFGTATCDGKACGIQCRAGYHLCGGRCVPDSSVASCGSSCTPCPSPANGQATCDGMSCGIACNPGFHLCGDRCVSNTSTASCGTSCTPCPTDPNGTATCDGTACGVQCRAGTRLCGGACRACPAGGLSYGCDGNACVITSCGLNQRLCNGVCAGCPWNAVSVDCAGTQCVATSCGPDARLCSGACPQCPSSGVATTTCSGSQCTVETCQSGHLLCGGVCSPCPTAGVDATACAGTTCVPTSCQPGHALCGGTCAPCPTTGVAGTACAGTQCVATSCQPGFRPCSTGCCAWQIETVDAAADVGILNKLAVDTSFAPHIVYYDRTNRQAKYARKSAGSWNVSVVGTAYESRLGISTSGTTARIAYDRRATTTNCQIVFATKTSTGWSETVVESITTSSGCGAGNPVMFVDSRVHLAWSHNTALYANSGNWSTKSFTSAYITTKDLVVTSSGRPYIASSGGGLYSNQTNPWSSVYSDSDSWMDVELRNGSLYLAYKRTGTGLKYATNESGTWLNTVVDRG
ncbi:MAG: hypothetical protein ACK4N5_08735, partial [Myxococcales bacterium]